MCGILLLIGKRTYWPIIHIFNVSSLQKPIHISSVSSSRVPELWLSCKSRLSIIFQLPRSVLCFFVPCSLPTALHCQTLTIPCAWHRGEGEGGWGLVGSCNGFTLEVAKHFYVCCACRICGWVDVHQQNVFTHAFLCRNERRVGLFLKEITIYNMSFLCVVDNSIPVHCMYEMCVHFQQYPCHQRREYYCNLCVSVCHVVVPGRWFDSCGAGWLAGLARVCVSVASLLPQLGFHHLSWVHCFISLIVHSVLKAQDRSFYFCCVCSMGTVTSYVHTPSCPPT